MSKKQRKVNRKSRNCNYTIIGDVTLNDFADSDVLPGRGRLKKSVGDSLEKKLKLLNLNKDIWREEKKKLEGFENDQLVRNLNVEETITIDHKRTLTKTRECILSDGVDYPLDIWFLISEYIFPEDICSFACICKKSNQVVNSAIFWFTLYKRFYKKGIKIPQRLQPECMVRHYGLRSCVIRSLYFLYPPFVQKAKTIMGFEADPHQLIRRQCVLVWHEKYKNQWIFCFKFKQVNNSVKKNSKKLDFIELLDDVFANPEEGCKVLQITCSNYVLLPMVLGQTLSSVAVTLDHAMRCKLQLVFRSGPRYAIEAGSVHVILNPVMKLSVLDWWHPLYPHSNDGLPFRNSSDSLI